jgi:rare lipoprotein A
MSGSKPHELVTRFFTPFSVREWAGCRGVAKILGEKEMNKPPLLFAGAVDISVLFRHGLWALAAAAIISGCSTTLRAPSYSPPVMPRPTAVARPAPSHIVRASWYGPGFDGRRTAAGEVFNEYGLTAASKTLPLGSRVRVTNLSTGRSVIVKINDRGPFVRGRGLDLSQAAARQVGITHEGVAKVKIARLKASQTRVKRMSATITVHDATGAGTRF